jgi:hypothetical protein
VSNSWRAVVNGVLVACILALALLTLDGANGRNLAISTILGFVVLVASLVHYHRT